MKKSVKVVHNLSKTPNSSPKIKCMVPAFFGDRFVEKEGGSATYKTSSRKLEDSSEICLKEQKTLKSFLKKHDQN